MIPLRGVIPTRTTPFVTVGLIALNAIIFLYQFSLGEDVVLFVRDFDLVPVEVLVDYRADVDVRARRRATRRRQHAVPVDLRR